MDRVPDDYFPTSTSMAQGEVENAVKRKYAKLFVSVGGSLSAMDARLKLYRDDHIKYLLNLLEGLPPEFDVLDASQPWLCFWVYNSLDLLGYQFTELQIDRLVGRVSQFRQVSEDGTGGFAGGDCQLPHLVSCYAAVMCLVLAGTPKAYQLIDREAIYKWFMKIKQPDGSFLVHEGGEIDVRGSYCVAVIGSLLNILTPELLENVPEFIARQSVEGGIGPRPGVEAHGGYTLCGMAALEILGQTDKLNLAQLSTWLSRRQMTFEGGFNGRANKLVDGCYTYWVGGCFPLLQKALGRSPPDDFLYDRGALQRYVLACCQYQGKHGHGGLIDKPGKFPDLYHTMYCLTGLSLSQTYMGIVRSDMMESTAIADIPRRMQQWQQFEELEFVLGSPENKLNIVHPVYNVHPKKVQKCMAHFYSLDNIC